MIIFVNERNEIKDVDVTRNENLKGYEIVDNNNPFKDWNVDKICCYRVTLMPETVTEVVDIEEVTYTDLEGNEVTEEREITETKETGKYFITMMTPYVDSRIIEPIVWLREQIKSNSADIVATDEHILEIETALCDLSMLMV